MNKRLSVLLISVAALCLCWAPPLTVKWVAIGDSITYLNDHPGETGNRVEKGYMTRVAEQLPGIEYVNRGYNGWTASRIAEKIDRLGLEKADVYTVFLGTNDWWSGVPAGAIGDYVNGTGHGTVYGAFRIIIDRLKSLNPGARIILITPLQRGDFVHVSNCANRAYGSYREKNGQQLADIVEAIKTIARHEQLTLVDLYHKSGIKLKNMVKFKRLKDPATGVYKNFTYPDYVDIPFDPKNDEYPYPVEAADMTYDGLHPSDRGNAAIAKMLVKELKKISGKTAARDNS
ncbi:MAG: SGNH/GDSL hydrolase family protein [Prevotellaceae bacterium]|jgi:lysophospholipase L1-like esterase|nr:SGNH/GDSL hydrolase family protein [Prevotellaceae bacterium]